MRAGAAVLLLVAGLARGDGTRRYDSPELSFDYPGTWKADAGSDVSAPAAVRLTPPASKRGGITTVMVIAGAKKISDGELESEAGGWHAAHLKNRVAWGMHSDGGMPRDVVHGAGGKRLVRYRDRVGSALGANEQTFTCGLYSSRLACVIVSAGTDARDDVDALTAALLAGLSVKKR